MDVRVGVMFPKPVPWRSKKYRDAAKGQPCTMRLPCCNGNPETTVLAHRNGAGMGTKADDHDACDACSDCHAALDGTAHREYHVPALLTFDAARLETIINRIERGVLR